MTCSVAGLSTSATILLRLPMSELQMPSDSDLTIEVTVSTKVLGGFHSPEELVFK